MMKPFMLRAGLAIGAAALVACAKGDRQSQSADSTARNLTLAPSDSTVQMHDVPAPASTTEKKAPATQPLTQPVTKKVPPPPPAPTMRTAASGTFMDIAVAESLSSRFTKAGDAFTASVVDDIKDAQGHVVIPAGSTVKGTVSEVKPAPNPSSPGTLTLVLSSVTVRGVSYPLSARIDSLETVRQGRGVTGHDAAKVGIGAAAGAILGRVLGKNTKGAIIGGVVGGAVGAGVAAETKDADIVLPKGAHINATLTGAVSVRVS